MSYFGHDEWAEVAPGLKRIEDATRIRRRILIAFERAELATDAAERQRLLTFAIVGGGPTGVEMAGAISEVARQSLAMDFRRIDPAAARIVLIEAGPRIMPTLPENLSDYVRRTLAKKGVEVMTSSRVMSCDAQFRTVSTRARARLNGNLELSRALERVATHSENDWDRRGRSCAGSAPSETTIMDDCGQSLADNGSQMQRPDPYQLVIKPKLISSQRKLPQLFDLIWLPENSRDHFVAAGFAGIKSN